MGKRTGGREEGRDGGRERGREGGREGGRDRRRERGREGGRERGREQEMGERMKLGEMITNTGVYSGHPPLAGQNVLSFSVGHWSPGTRRFLQAPPTDTQCK